MKTKRVSHLLRETSFSDAPDILVMSMYDAQKNEVAAFEELVGSHGGLGGYQSRPFLMYPSEWNLDEMAIEGSEEVYRTLKRKMVGLSLNPYKTYET